MVAYTREHHYYRVYLPLHYDKKIKESVQKVSKGNMRMFQGYKGDFDSQKELQIEVVFRINGKVIILLDCNGVFSSMLCTSDKYPISHSEISFLNIILLPSA
jgi:hypothetical protein